MGILNTFPTNKPTLQYCSFTDPANTSNTLTLNLNYTQMKRKPGSVRKYTMTTSGQSVILGSAEYPPSELSLSWNMLDSSQVSSLVAFTQIAPCWFVSNRNEGFLGVLVIDEVEELLTTRDVFSLKASFLVIAPYNGVGSSINMLTAPTLSASLSVKTGYITNPSDLYLWSTQFTPWGESTVSSVYHIHNTTTNAAYDISYTPSTSTSARKVRLYWNTTNTPTTATLLVEILQGFPQDNPGTFTLYNNYVTYSTITPT